MNDGQIFGVFALIEIAQNMKASWSNDVSCCRARLTCAQCLENKWLKQDTKNMEAKQLSKERMKKYILRRRWQVRTFICRFLTQDTRVENGTLSPEFFFIACS